MSLRRYAPLKPSAGTNWPTDVRATIRERDRACLGPRVGMPGDCAGSLEIDHIRASGAVGRKSPSTVENGALLCGAHHRLKTLEGRRWRPRLLGHIAAHS